MKIQSLILRILIIILLFPYTIIAFSQDTIYLKGSVVDHVGNFVPNVSIGIEGSGDLPVFTDSIGEFKIKVSQEGLWLNIEPSDDFKSKRVLINKREILKIYLIPKDLESNDDVVKIVNQEILKRNIPASFYSTAAKEMAQTGAISIDQSMQGRVPGLHVVNRSGLPGSGAFSLLNGPKSAYLSNEPLYIIDGVMVTSMGLFNSKLDGFAYNPLLALNVQDVSRMTIINDPAITSAYGSKASNGLVLIETLDPSATQTLIEIDMHTGINQAPLRLIPQLNASQHKTLTNEILTTSGMLEEFITEHYPNLFLSSDDERFIDYQHNTNWQSLIFNDALFSNINLKVKGGDEIARYGLSIGYQDSKGIIKETGYKGYNLRFISLLNIFTWLKMNSTVSMNYSNSNLMESSKVNQTSPIYTALSKSPMLNPYNYDNEGRELTSLAPVDEIGVSNPLAVIENFKAGNSNFHIMTALGAEAALTKDLKLNSNFGITYNVLKELIFMPSIGMELYYNDEAINVSKAANNSFTSFFNNTFLNFQKHMGKHSISTSTGLNHQINIYEFDRALTKNASANDQYRNLDNGTPLLRELSGDNQYWNWMSVYENVNYSYLDKYLVSASISLDGSTKVGDYAPNTLKINSVPFGVFYGGGLGWRVSNESFLKDLSWLEELKLRISYGKSGNDDIGEATATRYYDAIKFRGSVGLYPALVFNEELTYETVNQLTTGLDLALWGNRLTLNADLFSSVTSDMFIYKEIDSYYGYDIRPENNGKMKNKGLDLGLFFRIADYHDFNWDIQGTWASVENEITEIPGDKLVTKLMGADIVNMVGEQANSFYGYLFNGVYSTSEEALNANLVNDRLMPFEAGDAKFTDLSGPENKPDGIINNYDKTVIGSSLPEFYGGINNKFSYKRWTLSAFVQFVYGNEVFNFVRYRNESMTGLENQSKNVLNRWQRENQETNVPKASWRDPIGNSSFSTRWIEDGSYIRLKNVSLSYTIDNKFLAFRNAQFYVSANNVFTLTNYLGYDPEFAYSRSHFEQGIDYGLMPQSKQFIIGVKLGL